eukprot:CAMPEP_0174302244 /NCGR_PEP_ID=MMETSP0809-20121228/59522_1 /TAXON_ID=73025 ORGANISM="Eutreptiella gymnastica-like, Strain CCMP1594" /NCGR_SAMPLE_ID=MMETSP0809 /ASSEMBLY_ACC=CAM_ASM_000658 /LENGTH=66 /DNA_ID=CAMNT_0015408133 /DNA_START=452 /DNA_END=652 /DNA_ORIENTATION=-
MCHSVISALVAPGTQWEPAASHVRLSRIQLLSMTPDLADASGKSGPRPPLPCHHNFAIRAHRVRIV